MKPTLIAPGSKRLKLKYDKLLSNLAFNFNLRRYIKVWFMAPEFAGVARGMYKKAYLLMNEAGIVEVKGRNSPPTVRPATYCRCPPRHLHAFKPSFLKLHGTL